MAKTHKRTDRKFSIDKITREVLDKAGLEDVDASKRIWKCLDTKIRCPLVNGESMR